MKHKEIFKFIENWAPLEIAWEKDNPGLQIGSTEEITKGIVLSLDITDDVIEFAKKEKCNLIISHHPLIFFPIKSLNFSDYKNSLIRDLINNDITIYSAHTNLDFTKNGVSFALAKKLGLEKITFLENAPQTQFKLVTFVPEQNVRDLINRLSEAGAGVIGDYTHCSYKLHGKGTFFGQENTSPRVGMKGRLEEVDEIRLEMIFEKWKLNRIIRTLLSNHPYEEPAYDIYPLMNRNVNYGYGAKGFLKKKLPLSKFVELVKKNLKSRVVKFSEGNKKYVAKIAVCGGSGSDLIQKAISEGCDAFVTSDIKYHSFLDYGKSIALIDAGHYYTEIPILEELEKRLKEFISSQKEKIKIVKFLQKAIIKFVE